MAFDASNDGWPIVTVEQRGRKALDVGREGRARSVAQSDAGQKSLRGQVFQMWNRNRQSRYDAMAEKIPLTMPACPNSAGIGTLQSCSFHNSYWL